MKMLVIMIILYFLPTIIAELRRHRQGMAIGALNFLLGWTVLGWIAALIWALTTPAPARVYVVEGGWRPVHRKGPAPLPPTGGSGVRRIP